MQNTRIGTIDEDDGNSQNPIGSSNIKSTATKQAQN